MANETTSPVRQGLGARGQAADPGLARSLSEFARELQAQPSTERVLQRIVEGAVMEIAAADQAGISEFRRDGVAVLAATGDIATKIDRIQHDAGEGPCLTALREHVTVRSDDLSTELRWPVFSAAARAAGVCSMLSVPLFVEGDNIGALNLYSSAAKAFTDDEESAALLFASHAAVALHASRLEANLRAAITSRDVIGQAKGVLMERLKVDAIEAFELLIVASQRTHRKLHEVASEIAETGELRSD